MIRDGWGLSSPILVGQEAICLMHGLIVVPVPRFQGLGSPHAKMDARAAFGSVVGCKDPAAQGRGRPHNTGRLQDADAGPTFPCTCCFRPLLCSPTPTKWLGQIGSRESLQVTTPRPRTHSSRVLRIARCQLTGSRCSTATYTTGVLYRSELPSPAADATRTEPVIGRFELDRQTVERVSVQDGQRGY